MSVLAPVLEAFFTERLMTQRRASPNTIASYRDTFRLHCWRRTGTHGETAPLRSPRGRHSPGRAARWIS
jgi:hypothetical protein